jgi:TrpR-related protein YerC/YecD
MSRFNINKASKGYRIQIIGEFYDLVSCLKNRNEVQLYIKDLLFPDEIAMFHRRTQIAIMLKENHTFDEIKSKLHVGNSTIEGVKRALERHGEGYDLLIKRFQKLQDKKNEKRVEVHKRKTAQYPSIRRYAGGSLIADMLDELKRKNK